jgi:hypothetical protein
MVLDGVFFAQLVSVHRIHAYIVVINGMVFGRTSVAFDIIALVDFIFVKWETVFHRNCLNVSGSLGTLLTGKFEVSIIIYKLLKNGDLVKAGQIDVKDVLYLVIRLFIVLFAFFREVLSRAAVGVR